MEQADPFDLLIDYASSISLALSQEQVGSFKTYLKHLQSWNKTVNLTTITDTESIVVKHFIDSIAILALENMNPSSRVIDVGSGAGFPGIPLKIARPDLHLTLVEPSPKKASFLHFIVGCLELGSTQVFSGTFERFLAAFSLNAYEYITTRALNYDFLLSECLDYKGRVILYTSSPLEKSRLGSSWFIDRECAFDLPKAKGNRVITVLRSAL